MKGLTKFCCVGVACLATLLANATTVFDNTSNDLLTRFNPQAAEVGDEIVILPGQGNIVTNFIMQYWLEGTLNGNETMQVRFYANDGPAFGGAATPGTLLYDSGAFNIGGWGTTSRSTLNFDLATLLEYNGQPVVVPNDFTWTVQFSGLDPVATGGLDLYDPPTIGASYKDYWEKDPINGWQTKTNQYVQNVNFAARVEAVPEPNAIALGAGGALLFVLFRAGLRRR